MAAGISVAQIRTGVGRGELIRLDRGLYASAERVKSLNSTDRGALALGTAVALVRLGPQAVASHQTAARLLGLALLGRGPAGIAITQVPGIGSRKGGAGVRMHHAALPAGHVGQCDGVPVTVAARTVLDLARVSPFRAGVVVADSALRDKLTTKRELQALPGADGRVIARVDFYWERFRTIAEADGELKYDNRFEATYQLRRDADLRDAGFEVVHFGWRDIFDTPAQVAASIRAAFRRGGRRPEAV